jgi:sortase A
MLLKAGLSLMAFALALTVVAVAVTVASREVPEKAVAEPVSEATVEPLIREYLPPEPEAKAAEPRKTAEPTVARAEAPPEQEAAPAPEREPLQPESRNWPAPTPEQVAEASEPRRYDLPPGAVMGLTVKSLGLYDVPVFDSDGAWALANGVSHEPGTSMPWSRSEHRNVYLQGHRFGWPGTDSHLVFYHLNRLSWGDEVLLKNRDGKKYTYRVTETFVVEPNDSWVMGRARGRDMVTLQTCTPIPSFEKRLIVRADRV